MLIRAFLAVVALGFGVCTHDLALPLDGYLAFRAWLEDSRGGWQ